MIRSLIAALFLILISNPSFAGYLRVASGSYTGNAVDNRAITGVGFQPNLIMIKPADTSSNTGAWSWPNLGSDLSIDPNATSHPFANAIQSFDADGFTIGNAANVNTTGVTYNWVAFKGSSEYFYQGSYTGNGTARSITGVGFQPDFIFSKRTTGSLTQGRAGFGSAPTYAFPFSAINPGTGIINSFDSDGFSISSNSTLNTAGSRYDFFAIKVPTGYGIQTTYAGNNTDNTNISLGFRPEFILMKKITGGQQFAGRNAAMVGDDTIIYAPSTANATDRIQDFIASGFTVGANAQVNTTGTYHFIALRDFPGDHKPYSFFMGM